MFRNCAWIGGKTILAAIQSSIRKDPAVEIDVCSGAAAGASSPATAAPLSAATTAPTTAKTTAASVFSWFNNKTLALSRGRGVDVSRPRRPKASGELLISKAR